VSPVNGMLSWLGTASSCVAVGAGVLLQTLVVMRVVLALASGIAVALDACWPCIQLVQRFRHGDEEPDEAENKRACLDHR